MVGQGICFHFPSAPLPHRGLQGSGDESNHGELICDMNLLSKSRQVDSLEPFKLRKVA